MSQTILVKSVSSLSEARYCSGMMVDYISFDLNPESDDYVAKEQFEEIKNWLSGVKILGSFATADIFEIISALKTYSLDGFIFDSTQLIMLDEIDVTEKFLEVNDRTEFTDGLNVNYIVSDTINENIEAWQSNYNVLLGYKFENVSVISDKIAGYAFKGSRELRPGINNYDGLMEALETLEDRA